MVKRPLPNKKKLTYSKVLLLNYIVVMYILNSILWDRA